MLTEIGQSIRKLWGPGDRLWTPVNRVIDRVKGSVHDAVTMEILRRNRRGRPYVQSRLTMGPNEVRAWVGRGDGSILDLGVSRNLLTNIGRDWWIQALGKIPAGNQNTPASTVTATSLTGTGTVWTASNLATPQLGLAGLRVVAPITSVGTAPVYGNIVSNTNQVLTLDQWWTGLDGVGTTPANTNSFIIMPGGINALRFMALSTNASAASAADTTLANEVTSNGGSRVLALYTHTYGQATATLTNTYTASGTITAIHKIGLFAALTAAGADPMVYETVLNADATLVSGDTLAVTWTPTYSG